MDHWTNNPTIATYDRIAPQYAARVIPGLMDAELTRFAGAVAGDAPTSRFRILDAGCGPGHDSRWFRERGFRVVGVDLSAGMLAEARRQAPEVTFCQADLHHLSFSDGSFDGIWSCASLLHLPRADVPDALRDFRRILGEGYLYLLGLMAGEGDTVIDEQYGPNTPRVFTYFQRRDLELGVTRAGFQVVESDERPLAGGTWPRIRVLAKGLPPASSVANSAGYVNDRLARADCFRLPNAGR